MTRRIDNPDTAADIELRSYLDTNVRSNFIMVAGAGSGKTTSLIKALNHIGRIYGAELRRHNQQVACITYTEIAVGEILRDVGNNPLFHVSTIHSFLWSLIKPFQRDISAWVKQRIEATAKELRQKKAGFGPRVHQKTRDETDRDITILQKQLETIDKAKHYRYENGSDYCKGILGHDDIIKMVPQLIKDKPLLALIIGRKYPFFFIDESQDTLEIVVDSLKAVAQQMPDSFCLGFFGDPMQKIYVTGIGEITLDTNWKKITKPENFRCPTAVLSVIDKIRSQGDGLKQSRGRQQLIDDIWQPVQGTAKLFILPSDGNKIENLQHVRSWLADKYSDALWTSDSPEADVRILVIVHRMAAARLGFPTLFAIFNDGTPESLKSNFSEGTAWALKPFLEVLLPLSAAVMQNRPYEIMSLLRTHCPKLHTDRLKGIDNTSKLLIDLKESVNKLAHLLHETSEASILEVLHFADEAQLVKLDERLTAYIRTASYASGQKPPRSLSIKLEEGEDADKVAAAINRYLECPAKQLWGYHTYINDQSPYSTQQGIKGAEFKRVLVILDDDEGKHNQFSYDKLLGMKEPSQTDKDNQDQGKETVFDRTRRLFYVCCSRATKDLAVVFYSNNVEVAVTKLKAAKLFDPSDIHTLADISSAEKSCHSV